MRIITKTHLFSARQPSCSNSFCFRKSKNDYQVNWNSPLIYWFISLLPKLLVFLCLQRESLNQNGDEVNVV